jgi:nucleotide-binding universal stress UspA family protein
MRNGQIVVGVDAFAGASPAVTWASAECELWGADLLVIHSADAADTPLLSAADEHSDRLRDELAQRSLDEHRVQAAMQHPDIAISTMLSHSPVHEALIDASNKASLLVLGSHGLAGMAESILGSTAHRVVTHSHCPVVVVPGPLAPPLAPRRIVTGLAATRAGRLALRFALEEARGRGCSVTGVHAGVDPSSRDLHELKEAVAEQFPGVGFDIVVADDEPAEAILRIARESDLIVLGCHHSSDKWSSRLGDVPSAVLHRASVPVALVGQLA